MKHKLLAGILICLIVAGFAWAASNHYERGIIWQFDSGIKTDSISPYTSAGAVDLPGIPMTLTFCGQMAENGTIYFSPTSGVNGVDFDDGVDYSISGTACDGLDGATEGTQDLVVFPDNAIHVTGMYCVLAGTLGAGETASFTLHDDTAATTASVTCSMAAGETTCAYGTTTTTAIAAGSALDVTAVQSSNNSDDDGWCRVTVLVMP